MLPARKRALVLGGGADEGGGGCFPYEGVCVIYRISPCRGRVWDCAFAVVALASWVRSRQSRFSFFILGSHSFPPGGVAFSSSPFALRCDAYLFLLLYFLAVSASMVSLSPPGLARSPMATCCLDAPGPCLNFGSANPQGPEPTHTHKPKMLCTNRRARAAWTVGHGMPKSTAEWNHTFLPFLPPFVPSSRGGEIG